MSVRKIEIYFFFLHIGYHSTDTAKLKTAIPPAIMQLRYSAIPDAVVNAAVKQITAITGWQMSHRALTHAIIYFMSLIFRQ